MAAMDETDRKLISLLRANARTPVATLAKSLKVSRATVQNRINRMHARGDIGGFTIRVADETAPHRARAILDIPAEGRGSRPGLRRLRGFPHVRARLTT